MRARVFNIVQYETNPKTGESLGFTEDNIKAGVAHKTIAQYAYIRHDKDVYTAEDETKHIKALKKAYKDSSAMAGAAAMTETEFITANQYVKAGALKPPHWHIVLQCKSAVETSVIAKWFNIPENQIDCPKGRGAFTDCVLYLTHESDKEQAEGKYRYPDDAVTANFDWRQTLDQIEADRIKYGRAMDTLGKMKYGVMYEGMTLSQCIDMDKIVYMDNFEKLRKMRYEYIVNRAPLPPVRINYYVSGEGGVGKGLISRALARSLFPDIKEDCDIFFEVGAKGVAFDGYDGQPVIIWNDRRAVDLLQELGGRANVFNVFDTHPTRQKQNIKYANVQLCNSVNIINSVQPYEDFLDGLAGEYTDKRGEVHKAEDKKQSYRRVPLILSLHYDDFDMLINSGFWDGTDNFLEFYEYRNIRGNMAKIRAAFGSDEERAREIENRVVSPIVDKHNTLVNTHTRSRVSTIPEEFSTYGKGGELSQLMADGSREAIDENYAYVFGLIKE